MQMGAHAPSVTIAMVVGSQRKRAERALASVLAQPEIHQAEFILLDAGAADAHPLAGSEHPIVRTIRTNLGGTFGTLRAMAVRQARAPIVAFVEDHVEVGPTWLPSVLRSFEGPWAAVGAEIHNANKEVGISPAIALINYGWWSPPMQAGEADLLAGNNTAYRREVLSRYEDRLDELMLSDTVLQWQLAKDGYRLFAEPSISIWHLNPTTSGNAIKAEYFYHWAFAALRARVFDWSAWKRIRYVLLSPAVPWLRFARLVRLVRSKPPSQSVSVARQSLPILLFLHAAALGQNMGLLFGMRDSDQRFTDFELNSARPGPLPE